MRHRFGELVLDLATFELRRGGQIVPLQPKVFDVLRYLVEHPDRVVTKEELLDTLWPDEIVNEAAITWCISHARKAIGQGRTDREPIETVHGRGYRFRAGVTSEDAPPRSVPPPRPVSEGEAIRGEPLVGRDAAMRRLGDTLDRALAGSGSLVLVVGEAGIGKTRCANELAQAALRRGVTVLRGQCLEGDMAPSLWPWVQVLRAAEGRVSGGLEAERSALLAELTPGSDDGDAGAGDEFWLLDRVARFAMSLGRAAPAFLLFDDLQWADRSTLRAISLLPPELPGAPLLLVATVRELGARQSEATASLLRGLVRSGQRLALDALGPEDVGAYVRAVTGVSASAGLVRTLHGKTGGNPLLLRETVQLLGDRHGPGWPSALQPSQITVPEAIVDLLRTRLDVFTPAERKILVAASVAGESFDLPLLFRVTRATEDDLLAALDHAIDEGLIVERAALGHYAFAHDLVRDTLYHDVALPQRAEIHLRIALALEARVQRPADQAAVALHFRRALPHADGRKILEHAVPAARYALRSRSHEEAARLYEWAIEAAGQLGERADLLAELHLGAARAHGGSGRRDDSRRHLTLAVDVARAHRLGSVLVRAGKKLRPSFAWRTAPDPLAREALEEALAILPESEVALRAASLAELAGIPPYSLDAARSRELSDRAVGLARPLGGRHLVDALRSRLFSSTGPDSVEELLATTNEILVVEEGEPSWISLEAHYARMQALLLRGDVAGGEHALGGFGRLARDLHLTEAVWHHGRWTSQLAFLRGQLDRAEAMWQDLAAESARVGLRYGEILLPTHLAALAQERDGTFMPPESLDSMWDWFKDELRHRATVARLSVDAGQSDRARRDLDLLLERGLDVVAKDFHYLWILTNYAAVAAKVGDEAGARSIRDRLLPYARFNAMNTFGFTMGSVAHSIAILSERLGDVPGAIEQHGIALEENRRMGLRVHAAKSALRLAQLLLARPEKDRARMLVAEARGLAAEIGLGPVLSEAERLEVALAG